MDKSFLKSKVILIISPQSWGNMLLAKHHYAIELAKRGNEVYFLNPPDDHHWKLSGPTERISLERISDQFSLYLINQILYFPYRLKFHFRDLYNLLIKKQVRDILRQIGKPVDLIWSFDLGNLFPLSYFNKALFKIFHPVDEPRDKQAILAAEGADILFSVTNEIIEKYRHYKIPAYFVNHGLADEFVQNDTRLNSVETRLQVGLSGNLLRPDLDRETLTQILKENQECDFHFYGSFAANQSNIGGLSNDQSQQFITNLRSFPNVQLHGVLKTHDLQKELNRMDLFLICYDIELDQSKGTNYHKVMEYLSTGKVIVSNNITTYREYPELIRMTAGRDNNDGLPLLFRQTRNEIDKWNAEGLAMRRIAFAKHNTYSRQLDRIDQFITDSKLVISSS